MVLLECKWPLKELVYIVNQNLKLFMLASRGWWWIVQSLLKKDLGQNLFGRCLFVWDSFRNHISIQTKYEVRKLKIDMAVVSAGCTKFVQAPYVVWNTLFKDKIHEYYDVIFIYIIFQYFYLNFYILSIFLCIFFMHFLYTC